MHFFRPAAARHARAFLLLARYVATGLLAACASEVPVAPAQLAPLAQPASDLVLASDLPVRLPTGYTRTVPHKVRWRAVGTVLQGTVYQPVATVFAIEGRNVHEAYLVVRGNQLQGFYLPAENHYSALSAPLTLPLEGGAQR